MEQTRAYIIEQVRLNPTYRHLLPIRKMFGLRVSVSINFQKSAFGTLAIEPTYGTSCWYDLTRVCKGGDVGEIFDSMMDIFKTIKYDKKQGFYTGIPRPDFKFLESSDVEMEYDLCCVCGDETIHKTKCGHTYCLHCRQQNFEIRRSTLCPICRKESDGDDDDRSGIASDDDM